jgi:hypothetical protein
LPSSWNVLTKRPSSSDLFEDGILHLKRNYQDNQVNFLVPAHNNLMFWTR